MAFDPDAYLASKEPSGFDPDAYLSKKDPQWSDLPKNIIPNAKAIGENSLSTAGRIAKGVFDFPSDVAESAKQELTGGSPLETPIAQDVKTVGSGAIDAVKGIPQSLMNLGSKKEWIENPVSNAITAGSIAAPMLAPEEGGIAASIGKGMEEKGASLANDLGEVSGTTVKKVNPRVLGEEAQGNIRKAGSTSNVADVRSEIGKKLVNDKVVGDFGQDVGDRLQKVNELKDSYGKQVDNAIKEIKDTNRKTGEYADVDDALHVQANPILKGVLDVTNELSQSARSGLRQTARFWRETYNSLAKKAEANNGRLNFDDIRSELQEVGKDMKGSKESPRYATSSDIYHHLAEVRDQMVNQIAEQSGNEKLGSNLINANKGYSFYSKMADGLQEAGAGGEVPEKMGKHMVRSTMRGDPMHATGYLGLMKFLNAIEPAMAQKLVKWGPGVAKYGSILESAAKQGSKNLAVTDYLLKQQDPEYAKAMQ